MCLWSIKPEDSNDQEELLPVVQGEPRVLFSLHHAGHVSDIQVKSLCSEICNVKLFSILPKESSDYWK